MLRFLKSTALATMTCVLATSATGQQVMLETKDGSVSLSGNLMEFDGATYVLQTSLGVLRLKSDIVICTGDACPVIEPPMNFAVSGAAELTQSLFPELLAAYSISQGTAVETTETNSGMRYVAAINGSDDKAEITATAINSAQGLKDLLQGNADVALSTRALRPEEVAGFNAAGIEALNEHILAIEGLVIVTAPGNSLPSISIDDAARIFSGQYQNWAELGGPDAPIQLYTRANGSGIAEAFEHLVMAPNNQEMSASARMVETDAELAELVANDPAGIGFTRYSGPSKARPLPIIGVCGLVVTPNEFNIKTEEYPLAHRLYAFTKDTQKSEFLYGFLDYLSGDAVQTTITKAGLLNQDFTSRPIDQQGMRFASALRSEGISDAIPQLQKMVSEMVVSERLSATFRFETGSSELDSRARSDIARVADLINAETGTNSRKIVRIMGFTDSLGSSDLNRELSQRRAKQVVDALLELDPSLSEKADLRPMGFGDVSPIGCDETAKGRWTNRRVEVWISSAPT